MSHKNNITFIIFAFNEAARIHYPIKCYLPYGDVLIVDNFSTDGTAEIAKSLGARVFQFNNSPNQGIPECKEEAEVVLKQVNTEWIFWGFADEMIPKSCLEKYQSIANSHDQIEMVVQKHKTMLYKSEWEFLPAYCVTKFFKVGSIEFLPFGEFIHGIGPHASHIGKNNILFLPPIDEFSVFHFSVYNTEKILSNHNKYSTIHSRIVNKNFLELRIILEPILTFLVILFLHGSIRKGVIGFIVAVQYSFYTFQVLAKAYEIKHGITLEGIENNFKNKKIFLLDNNPKSSELKKAINNLRLSIFSKIYSRKHIKKN